jgi:hypothetical protein
MSVSDEVRHERQRQRSRWGAQHDRNHSWYDWRGYMGARVGEVYPSADPTKRRRALIELAALAIAAVEANE